MREEAAADTEAEEAQAQAQAEAEVVATSVAGDTLPANAPTTVRARAVSATVANSRVTTPITVPTKGKEAISVLADMALVVDRETRAGVDTIDKERMLVHLPTLAMPIERALLVRLPLR